MSYFLNNVDKNNQFIKTTKKKYFMDELKEWYNGYINEDGNSIYNPMSVCKALDNGGCQNYWGTPYL